MHAFALEQDAWVGTIEDSHGLKILLDLENRTASRPPCEGLLSLASEVRALLLAARPRAGLGGEPWHVRIEAPAPRIREIDGFLTFVPTVRVTQFASEESWTARCARGGMTLQNPARFEPPLRLLALRLHLVLGRVATMTARLRGQ